IGKGRVPTVLARLARSDLEEQPPQAFGGDGHEGLPILPGKAGLGSPGCPGLLDVLQPDVSGELGGHLACVHPFLLLSSWVMLNYSLRDLSFVSGVQLLRRTCRPRRPAAEKPEIMLLQQGGLGGWRKGGKGRRTLVPPSHPPAQAGAARRQAVA